MTTILTPPANRSPKRRQRVCGRNKQSDPNDVAIAEEPKTNRMGEEVETEEILYEEGAPLTSLGSEYLKSTAQVLQYVLETNFWSCDAKWTLFVAAAFSYRYDSVLQPFPPQFASERSGYDIDSLITVIKDTPKLFVTSQHLMEELGKRPSKEVIDLLFWVLVIMKEPSLRLVEGEELTNILESFADSSKHTKPTHVFEVVAPTGYHSEAAFRARVKNLPLKMGFMGNRLENYFSILFNGFGRAASSTNKVMLTTDLETSLQDSPYCAAWGASQCGSIISCTAICEFALNSNEDQIMPNKNTKNCVDIYLKNPDHVRLRYLIFYGKRSPKGPSKNRFLTWICSHKFSFSFLSYLLLLLTIGIANSSSGETIKIYTFKKFDLLMEFCRKFISKEPSQ